MSKLVIIINIIIIIILLVLMLLNIFIFLAKYYLYENLLSMKIIISIFNSPTLFLIKLIEFIFFDFAFSILNIILIYKKKKKNDNNKDDSLLVN